MLRTSEKEQWNACAQAGVFLEGTGVEFPTLLYQRQHIHTMYYIKITLINEHCKNFQ